jgi:hypothetical protein
MQVRAELGHDLRRQVPIRFAWFGFGGYVADGDREVLAKAGGDSARAVRPMARMRVSTAAR